MKTIVCTLIFCLLGLNLAYTQGMDDNNPVMYDPTFWKQDLRLTKQQYFAINEINSTFYSNLIQVARETVASKEVLASTNLLNQRKNLILELLSPRQKSKWKKISKSFN